MRQTTSHKSETATFAAPDQSARLIAAMQGFMAADAETEIVKAVARQMRAEKASANQNRPAKRAA